MVLRGKTQGEQLRKGVKSGSGQRGFLSLNGGETSLVFLAASASSQTCRCCSDSTVCHMIGSYVSTLYLSRKLV